MEYSGYLRLLSGKSHSMTRCQYCGSFVALGGRKEGFCQFCEGYVHSRTHKSGDLSKLSQIQDLLDSNKTADARAGLDALTSQSSDPILLFGAAHIYGYLSSYKYHDLDYNRKGFMEENSANVYSSLDLTSKSKEMFYKSIRLINDQTKDATGSEPLYLNFVSYIKLKRLFDAGRSLVLLKSHGHDVAREYAEMVYAVESGRKEGKESAIGLIGRGNINAIYYLARCYVKEKKLKEAKSILEKMTGKVRMPDAVFLLHKIDRLLEETKL